MSYIFLDLLGLLIFQGMLKSFLGLHLFLLKSSLGMSRCCRCRALCFSGRGMFCLLFLLPCHLGYLLGGLFLFCFFSFALRLLGRVCRRRRKLRCNRLAFGTLGLFCKLIRLHGLRKGIVFCLELLHFRFL